MLLAGRNTGAAPLACQSRHSRAQQSSCRRVIAARAAATEEFTPAEGPLSVPDEGPSFSPLGDDDEVPESGVAVAHLRFVGGSASKVRRVLNMIRGKPYGQAIQLMTCSPYRATEGVISCLLSAAANAKHTYNIKKGNMYVHSCYANEGPTKKTMRYRAKGQVNQILHRSSHITIKIAEESKKPVAKKGKRRRKGAQTSKDDPYQDAFDELEAEAGTDSTKAPP